MLYPSSAIQQQNSTRFAFFTIGLCMGAWAPLIPFVKLRLGIDEWTLGMLLLCLGVGSIVTMPFSSVLTRRFGCRRVLLVSCVITCASLLLLSFVPTLSTAVVSLLIFGAAAGAADCAVNIQGVIVERNSGRTMMSGFHGYFSAGALIGATGVALLLSLGADPVFAITGVALIALLTTGAAVRHALPYAGKLLGPAFALPRLAILMIGMLTLVAALAEGAVLDWSAVFLSGSKGMDVAHAGLGYAIFALVMTLGRLFGDIFVHRLGAKPIVALGGGLSSFGFAITVFASSWQIALAGFILIGAGLSNLFPVLVSLSASQKSVPENIAVPAVLTLGYLGILMGPALIGFLTHFMSLPNTFLVLAAALLALAAATRRI